MILVKIVSDILDHDLFFFFFLFGVVASLQISIIAFSDISPLVYL